MIKKHTAYGRSPVLDALAYTGGYDYASDRIVEKASRDPSRPILQASVSIPREQFRYREVPLDYVKRQLVNDLSTEIVKTASFGIEQHEDVLRCATIYSLKVAVMPVAEFNEMKRLADRASLLEAQLKDALDRANQNAAKAKKYDEIKAALK